MRDGERLFREFRGLLLCGVFGDNGESSLSSSCKKLQLDLSDLFPKDPNRKNIPVFIYNGAISSASCTENAIRDAIRGNCPMRGLKHSVWV